VYFVDRFFSTPKTLHEISRNNTQGKPEKEEECEVHTPLPESEVRS
jgi:hypothetical protein